MQLDADWTLPGDKMYSERAIFTSDADGAICFWSFTSDGKNSQGKLTDANDIHPAAISFIAQMPGGLARTTYWPSEDGFEWTVESKTAKGWNRFMQHSFKPIPNAK